VLSLFAVEYLTRVVCAPRPLRYIFSFWGLIDLLAILPLLALLNPEWLAIRVLRLLRLIRLLKLFRTSRALDRMARAFRSVRGELTVFAVLAALVLYVAAVGIYVFEHPVQPEAFSSIPKSLWWAVASLTTVGYGDLVPLTLGGRIFTTLVLFVGLGVVAGPAAIITTALLEADKYEAKPVSDPEDETQSKTED
jgi:voltage-gated potassium channel